MKKSIKYLALAFMMVTGLAACQKSEAPDYEAAPAESGEQVFFPTAPAATVKLAKEDANLTIALSRASSVLDAVDVNITASGDALAYFDVPAKVSFAADAKTTNLTISCKDVASTPLNEYFGLTVAIADEIMATSYGASSLTFDIGIELPWITFDVGTMAEIAWWGEEEPNKTLKYQQISDNLRYCVVEDCWGYETGSSYPVQPYIWYWNTETNQCYIPVQFMGYENSNGKTYVGDESSFYNLLWAMKNGAGYGSENGLGPGAGQVEGTDAWFEFCDAFRAKYPEDFYPYYDGKGNFYLADQFIAGYPGDEAAYKGRYSNDGSDMFICSFAADYTIGLSYEGLLLDKEGVEQVLGELTVEGEDVTDVMMVLVEGKDPAVAVEELAKEEPANTQVVSAAGSFRMPMIEEAEPGKFTLVAVPVDVDGGYAWDFAVYETFQYGTVDPINADYSEFVATIDADDVVSRNWDFYARLGVSGGTFETDRTNVGPASFEKFDADTLIVNGIYGEDLPGGMKMELYKGVLYTTTKYVGEYGSYSSYILAPTSINISAGVYSSMYDNTLAGAFVDEEEGIIAFIDCGAYESAGVTFAGWGIGAFSGDGNYAGWWEKFGYPILVDTEVYPTPSAVQAALTKAITPSPVIKANLKPSRRPVVSTSRNYRNDVVASGRVRSANASKEIVDLPLK